MKENVKKRPPEDFGSGGALKLTAVRFVPFYAAGLLTAYFGAGVLRMVLFAAAAAAAILLSVKKKWCALCFAGAAAGILLMTIHMTAYCEPILEYAGKTVSGEFMICETGTARNGGAKYTASVRLNGRTAYVTLFGGADCGEGDVLSAEVELFEADEYYLAYNLSRNVLLSGNIVSAKRISSGGRPIRRAFGELRRGIFGRTLAFVGGDEGAIAAAMLFGDDGSLSASLFEQLRISGAAHYTAVSGAHFSVLATIMTEFVPKDRRRTRAFSGIAFAAVGVLFFGMSASVLRAAATLALNSVSGLFRRRAEPLNTLCCAVFLLTVLQPEAILDAGFAMSVLGTLGVSEVGGNVAEYVRQFIPMPVFSPVIDAASRSVCACLCTAPVSAALFKGCSAAGAFTTVMLAPLMICGMTFAALAAALNSPVAAVPVGWSMRAAKAITEFIGRKRALWITLDFNAAWIPAAVSALILVIMALGGFRTFVKLSALLELSVLCAMVMSLVVCRFRREIRFTGNSDTAAAVVINGTHAAVLVSGSGEGLDASVSRCMREHGAVEIDAVILPEGSYQGAAALSELSKTAMVRNVYANSPVGSMTNVSEVAGGSYITIGGKTAASYSAYDSADIVILTGRLNDAALESGQTAVYFAASEKNLSGARGADVHNAPRESGFSVKLEGSGELVIYLTESR